ncbi:hypothetical protein [Alicyclobacillus fastidiosus]|uniref:Uncharacterized protein n=1 Tax=Alicyclobacillus fastidiosus TaxID=392011 RepID=A0ABV5AH67_9BACL|nr:hypothetical protein [Alicyclobacillus fastidiosus]WEH09608.1 hypothetical protein PYS47_23725 [Alicyclobacillus fastidiosus]
MVDAVALIVDAFASFVADAPSVVFAHPTKPTRQTMNMPIPVTDFRTNTRFNPVPDTI